MRRTPAREAGVYVLARLDIHDRERYQRYVDRFAETLAPFEGRPLAADENVRVIDGEWSSDKIVLNEIDAVAMR